MAIADNAPQTEGQLWPRGASAGTGGGGGTGIGDSEIATLVVGPSQTRTQLDLVVQEATTEGVDTATAGLITGPSQTRNALDSAFAGTVASIESRITPAGPSKVIYVSSVIGNDELYTGQSVGHPLRTFDAAFNAIGSGVGEIILAPGETFPITKGYILDVNRHTITGNRSRLDSSGCPIGTIAITWMGSKSGTQFQPWNVFSGVELYGGVSAVTQQVGMLFMGTNSSKKGPSHVHLSNFVVRGYLEGIKLGDQSYCLTFNGFHLGNNRIGFSAPAGIENSGERISFVNGTFFNSPTFMDVRHQTAEIILVNCSLDYFTEQAMVIVSAKVSLYGCHVEFDIDNTTLPVFDVSGSSGSINMYGGQLKAGTTDPAAALTRTVIENNGAWRAGSVFRDVMTHNLWMVTSGSFAGGTGLTRVENESNYGGATRSNESMGGAVNLLADGSFEEDSFVDDWFILSDASTPTVRKMSAGDNLNGTISDAYNNDSGKSLRIGKTASSGQPAAIALAVPMQKFATPHVTFSEKHPMSGSGNVYITFEAAIMRYDSGVPKASKREVFGGAMAIDLGEPSNLWNAKYMIAQYRMPPWATHLLIVFNMGSTSSGSSIYIDSMRVGQS